MNDKLDPTVWIAAEGGCVTVTPGARAAVQGRDRQAEQVSPSAEQSCLKRRVFFVNKIEIAVTINPLTSFLFFSPFLFYLLIMCLNKIEFHE